MIAKYWHYKSHTSISTSSLLNNSHFKAIFLWLWPVGSNFLQSSQVAFFIQTFYSKPSLAYGGFWFGIQPWHPGPSYRNKCPWTFYPMPANVFVEVWMINQWLVSKCSEIYYRGDKHQSSTDLDCPGKTIMRRIWDCDVMWDPKHINISCCLMK